MSSSRPQRHSFERALGLSIALHIICAPLLVAALLLHLSSGNSPELGAAGDATSTRITLSRRPRPPAQPAIRRVAAARKTTARRPLTAAERHIVLVKIAPAAPHARGSQASDSAPLVRANVATLERARPQVIEKTAARTTAEASVPVSEVVPAVPATSTPVLTPSAPPVATAAPSVIAARGYDNPAGGWGQNFEKPLFADEAALAELRAKFRGASQIKISVDENGKAVKISLPDSMAGEARSELERRLVALRYIPAECNGLRCAGILLISL